MIIINEIDSIRFSYNGIAYFKNFTPIVRGNKIEVVNTYDRKIVLTDAPTLFSEYEVDGLTYGNVADLQIALLPILFTRASLGGGSSSVVESVTGYSVDNTDPLNPVVNAIPLIGTEVGSPVTGDVKFQNDTKLILNDVGGDIGFIQGRSDGIIEIRSDAYPVLISGDAGLNVTKIIQVEGGIQGVGTGNELRITGNNTGRGLIGVQYYGANYDNNTYVQKKYVDDKVSGTTNYISKFTGSNSIGNSQIYDNGTNLGVGTTSPSYKLDVSGTGRFTDDLNIVAVTPRLKLTDGNSTFLLSTNTSGEGIIKTEGTSKNIRFFNNSGETVRINGGGNVSIGNTNNTYKLDVSGTGRFTDTTLFQSQLTVAESSGDSVLEVGNSGIGGNHRINIIAAGSAQDAGYYISGTPRVYTNTGNTSITRINAPSTGIIQFETNLTERVRINNGGNVSIGNTNNTYKLDVSGTGRFTSDLTVQGTGNSSFAGKVGIGTTAPTAKLTIGGLGIGNTGGLKIEDPSNTAYGAHFSYNDASKYVVFGGITNNVLNDAIAIERDAARTITIDNLERVGIGTSSPAKKLDVIGTVGASEGVYLPINKAINSSRASDGGNVPMLRMLTGTNTTVLTGGYGALASTALSFQNVSSTELMVIQGTGNVGIGTTSPKAKLHVVGLPTYADNATALAGGLTVGAFYHTAGVLKVVI